MEDDELLELVDLPAEQDNSGSEQPNPARETLTVYSPASRVQRDSYEAYRKRARPPHLKIRLAGGRRAPAYHHLLDIASNEAATELELVYRFLIVRIHGKNMGVIIDAIENHACDFIQEFNPLIFARPAPDAPIIEAIRFPADEQDSGGKGEVKKP